MSVIELRTFVGTQVKYKGYNLRVVEVTNANARLMDPSTGATAVVTAQKLRSLIMNQRTLA